MIKGIFILTARYIREHYGLSLEKWLLPLLIIYITTIFIWRNIKKFYI